MIDLLKSLSGTPLPTILVISGIFFLFLSLAGGVSGKIELPEKRQLYTGISGIILLIVGLAIYLIPSPDQVSGSGRSDNIPNNAQTDTLLYSDYPDSQPTEPFYLLWSMVGDESFSYFENDWYTGTTNLEGVTSEQIIRDGLYRWNLNFNRSYYFYQLSPYGPSVNSYIAFDLRFSSVSSDTSYNQVQTGLLFRKTENKDYRLYVDSNGYLKVIYYENGTYHDLTEWLRIPQIDPTQFNRFGIVADNELIQVYVNNRQVIEIYDYELTSGNAGLITESYGPVSAVVEFDNFEYRVKP